MTDDTDGPEYRTRHRAAPERVRLHTDDEEGIMSIRMPVASTGDVRNEGDDPLTTGELRGMATQINNRAIGVFPEHGMDSTISEGVYSQFEKLGVWREATVEGDESGDGEDLLVAEARMPDPETLPATTGPYRTGLAILKEQALRGIPLDSSIGWREDEEFPGGNDLMEVSIVGIGADPRTNTAEADPVATVTRAAVDAGADPGDLLESVRAALPDDARPFGPPEDPNRWEDHDECVAEVEDWDGIDDPDAYCGSLKESQEQNADAANDERDHDRATYEVDGESIEITPPDAMVTAAREALDAKERYDELADCGTGVGEDRARQIIDDEVGPEVIEEIAAYLTSHAEDVADIEDPPTDWDEDTWTDGCGPVQYALWGGTATGTGLDYAQRKANEVADAKGESQPYDRMTEDTDPPDDGGTDTEAQDADDPDANQSGEAEVETRAPEDIDEADIAEFVSEVYDGVDAADIQEVMADAGAEFTGLSIETVGWFFADVLDVTAGEVQDMVEESTDEQEMDDDEDEEDEDDEEEDMETSSIEQEVAALRERQAELEERLADGASPSDVTESPEPDEDQDAEPDEQRDTDADGADSASTDVTNDIKDYI